MEVFFCREQSLSRHNFSGDRARTPSGRPSRRLRWALFDKADLRGASFRDCDLRFARFTLAKLDGADFRGATLPPPGVMLQARWGKVPPALARELMRYDAENHPEPQRFGKWAKGGPCPYYRDRDTDDRRARLPVARAANFDQLKRAWKPGRAMPAYKLMLALFKLKKIKR